MPKKTQVYTPNLSIARALVIVAAFINAPRYAAAFALADATQIPVSVADFINFMNILGGLAMGLLEAVAVVYILDGLRRLPFSTKNKQGKEKFNWRWWGSLFFAVSLLVMSPFILVPPLNARMNDEPLRNILQDITQQSTWNFFIVIAPAFIIAGVSFSQPHFIGGTFTKVSESSEESSRKVSGSFPKHWRKFSDDQKRKLATMTDDKISATVKELGLDPKTAGNWVTNLKREGYRK